MSLMRPLYILLACLILPACSSPVPPAPTQAPVEQPVSLSLGELMQAPERWSGRLITLIAPLHGDATSRILAPGPASQDGPSNEPVGNPSQSLWLAEPLPSSVAARIGDGPTYLKLRGRLSPPGAFGADTRFPYQFSAENAAVIEPERTTLANLAENPTALDGALLEVSGTLLVNEQDALLTEEESGGGVPATGARQIKLRGSPPEAALAALQQRGEVRYGSVIIVGWWQDGALAPFLTTPITSSTVGPASTPKQD